MFKVCNNGKEQMFTSKDEVILYLARLEAVPFGLYSEEKLQEYVPYLFDHVALCQNDRYHPGVSGHALHGEFWMMMDSTLLPRTLIVYEDNRIIDIRAWLPEFRACLIRLKRRYYISHHRFILSGSKPTHTKTYRIIHGYRQSQMPLSESDREDIMDALGYIPGKFQRAASRMDDNIRTKRSQRSWKENTKARRNWQRHKKPGDTYSIRKPGEYFEEPARTDEDMTQEILDALFDKWYFGE